MIYLTSAQPKNYWIWENEEGDISRDRWDNSTDAKNDALSRFKKAPKGYRRPAIFLEKMQWNANTEEYECVVEKRIL